MQQHVIQHGAQRVLGVVALRRHFHRFRNRNAEAAGMIGRSASTAQPVCVSSMETATQRGADRFPSRRGDTVSDHKMTRTM